MKKIAVIFLAMIPALTLAHPGHESASSVMGMVSGALHPLLGLDHLLAILAVGLFSARLTAKHRIVVPAVFLTMMATGFYMAHAGLHSLSSTFIETAIMLSLMFVGVSILVLATMKKSQLLTGAKQGSAWLMTVFAVFHGLAHGLEVPAGASMNGFALGFLASSALLMVAAYGAVTYVLAKQHKSLQPIKVRIDS